MHLFIYFLTSREYPGHHASNFILFLWSRYSTVDIIMYTNFLRVSWDIVRSPLQITPCSIVNLCLISVSGLSTLEQFLYTFFFLILDVILHITGSCLASTAILSRDKASVSTQSKKCIFKLFLCFIFWLLVKSQSW